jgi:hypothetical protein
MKVPWFAEHMGEELVLHRWHITGDAATARAQLAQPWMTTHSVFAVGRPLPAKGAKQLRPGERLRTANVTPASRSATSVTPASRSGS